MAIPGLLYAQFVPGAKSTGALSRDIVNGSSGTGRRFQKSPFQPVSWSCGLSPSSASSIPDACEPRWRMVMSCLRATPTHWGTNFAALSSREMRPSLTATASDTPPTRALAFEAV